MLKICFTFGYIAGGIDIFQGIIQDIGIPVKPKTILSSQHFNDPRRGLFQRTPYKGTFFFFKKKK